MSTRTPENYQITVNGVRLAIRDWGAGSGLPCCLLIHGLADGAFVWDDFAQRISGSYRAVAVDLRGHGDSDPDPQGKYSLDVLARDVVDIAARLELGGCLIVGHSLGAEIALRISASPVLKPRAVVLVDAGPGSDPQAEILLREQLIAGFHAYPSRQSYSSWLAQTRPLLSSMVCDRLAQGALGERADGTFWPRYDPDIADLLSCDMEEKWWWSRLGSLSQPVLVVRGSGSAVLRPSTAAKMAKSLPRGAAVTVPLCGHSVMSDNPDGFFAAVWNFVRAQPAPYRAATGERV